ncbi:hypothetical protein DVH24_031709 [Malus domestica]|uniref:Uncharacterized protein n=1 Tax=Malus domestica TaxID=3750 RepID=A0A498J681_MALDO|nr:hypothetical protein DVH24_031709 [Malus domestica]
MRSSYASSGDGISNPMVFGGLSKDRLGPVLVGTRALKESDDVLVNDKPWASGVQEALTGSHVFVCAHGSRDNRCGVCGPVLIDKFKEEAELRGLTNQVFVTACSHIGGHKYAGNLIIYSLGSDRSISGHWGQIGASCDEAEKINDPKLPNGGESKKIEEKPQENGNRIENNENFSGRCQGANSNGFTCCKEASLEQNSGSEEKKLKETRESCARKDALGKLSSLIGNWEQSDVLAAAAVVGAVATVAVAYSFYRSPGIAPSLSISPLYLSLHLWHISRSILAACSLCFINPSSIVSTSAQIVPHRTAAIEGLFLYMPKDSDEHSFNTEAFKKMRHLKFLVLNYVKLTGSYKHFSMELRLLSWFGFPLEAIPAAFDLQNLVYMDLRYSKLVRVWEDSNLVRYI